VNWTLNILRFPSFQAPAILPLHIKLKAKDKLSAWLETKKSENNKMLSHMEINQIQRLIDYLETVTVPHRNTAGEEKLFNDFKVYYHQYDLRRNKDFVKTFPTEFTDFYKAIDVPLPVGEMDKKTKFAYTKQHSTDDYDKDK